MTAEAPDQDGEVMDYVTTVPYYKALKEKFLKATEGKSLAPLREMHQLSAVGAGKEMDFDDSVKSIHMGFKVVDDDAWVKVQEGVYTGFSQGGRYVKTWKKGALTYYTADPGEISLVDNPCLPSATFEYVKSGGSIELRKFKQEESADDRFDDLIERLTSALEEQIRKAGKKIKAVVGHVKGESTTTVQTIIFSPKDDWSVEEAKAWLSDHDLKSGKVDETEDSYRFRQRDPQDFDEGSFKTIPFKGGKISHGDILKSALTKHVAGEDLLAAAFAYVGDPSDQSTWKVALEFQAAAKTKLHVRNALARYSFIKGIPASAKAKVKQAILAAAMLHGVDVGKEAAKIFALHKFLRSSALEKGMYDVKDLSDVLSTLAFVQSCLTQEREYEGDESTVPEDLLQVMEALQQVFLDLVQEETDELIEHARSLGEKAMKPDTLEKALSQIALMKAATEKAFGKLKKMLSDQHDSTVDMHKGFHSDTMVSKDHAAAKALATEHLGKAIAHSGSGLSKALDHIDKSVADMTAGDTSTGGGGVSEEALTVGGSGTEPHTAGKGLTVEALQAMLTKQSADLKKQFDEAIDSNTTNVLKAIFASDDGDGAALAAPGIGDRTQVSVAKVHQTHPVTKADDAPGAGAGGGGTVTVTVDDAKKAFTSGGPDSQDALLKIARSIKPNPSGVPATLQGSKLLR